MRRISLLLTTMIVVLGLTGAAAEAAAAEKDASTPNVGTMSLADWRTAVTARGAVVSKVRSMSDGCVDTEIGRWGNTNKIDSVWVGNVCDFTLTQADVHAFDGWAYDRWRFDIDVHPGMGEVLPVGMYLPWGSLLCGEIWNWAGLWGRDCITI